MRDKKPPKGVIVAGVVLFGAIIGLCGIMGGAIVNRTKTSVLFYDVQEAKGPWTAVERFWDKYVLGYTDEEMGGVSRDAPASDADPFD